MCNSGVRFMISIFKLDGEESKAIFALEFNETPYLFLYFNQEWVNETDPEVKALKEEYSKAMDLNEFKRFELGESIVLMMVSYFAYLNLKIRTPELKIFYIPIQNFYL